MANSDIPARGELYVGTSGWSYTHWRNEFYPPGLPQTRWFEFYRQHFRTVEVNSTFYRLPAATTVAKWREQTNSSFRMVVKGSRYVTHIRRIRDCQEEVDRFIARIEPLGPALGPILWQLPPTLSRDEQLLRDFVRMLPKRFSHAIEFRHKSWFEDEVVGLLDELDIATISVSSKAMPAKKMLSGGFFYLRFHGLDGGWEHNYNDEELLPWVRWAVEANEERIPGYVFFNNDGFGNAPRNAHRFIELAANAAD